MFMSNDLSLPLISMGKQSFTKILRSAGKKKKKNKKKATPDFLISNIQINFSEIWFDVFYNLLDMQWNQLSIFCSDGLFA